MILGLDVSTSNVGYSIIDLDGKLIKMGFISLSNKKCFIQKNRIVRSEFDKINKEYNISYVFIEECLQRFSFGRSSANTIVKLALFNGSVQYAASEAFNKIPAVLNVNKSRKALQIATQSQKKCGIPVKEQVFHWVCNNIDYEWPTKILQSGPRKGQTVLIDQVYDMADAWVIARAGFIHLEK
jgi:Holliday junction resolvasome RuvABC endonuclease subunit